MIVEAETEAEARAAINAGADGVLLDEFSPALQERCRSCGNGP